MKVNLGSGQGYLTGWVNVDPDPAAEADVRLDTVEFIRRYGSQVERVHVGTLLRSHSPQAAVTLLGLLAERLPAGTLITASDAEPRALLEAFDRAGLTATTDTEDPDTPPSQGIVVRAVAAGPATGIAADTAGVPDQASWDEVRAELGAQQTGRHAEVGTQQVLLHRLTEARAALAKEAELRRGYEQGFEDAARQLEEARARLRALAEAGVEGADPDAPDHDGEQEPAADPRRTRAAQLPGNQAVVPPLPAPLPGETPATLRGRLRKAVGERLPEGSPRRAKAKAALTVYREGVEFARRARTAWRAQTAMPGTDDGHVPEISYDSWLADHRITRDQVDAQRTWAHGVAKNGVPLRVQVVVLPGEGDLGVTTDSLRAQSWEHLEAAVISPQQPDLPTADARFRAVRSGDAGPWAAVDGVLAASSADYVVVLHEGDTLEPDCLFTLVSAVRQDPQIELMVWDDDVRDGSGHRSSPRFRPSWSPEMLLGADYIGTAFAVRRDAVVRAGGLRTEFGDSALWHLLLQLELPDDHVFRSSRVLSSVGRRRGPDPATAAAAVQDVLDRRGWDADAVLVDQVVHVRWRATRSPKVSIVIPTRHNRTMLSTCLPSLMRTDYPDFEVVIVDNGGESEANRRWYDEHRGSLDLQVIWWTETPFNYSAVNNAGVARTTGDVLVFLNDDTELLDPGWLRELVGWTSVPEIGIAGLQLIGPDDEIQHTGVILGMGGFADHVFEGSRPHEDSIFGRNDWYRDCLAVTGACMGMRREFYDEVGGMDERFILCGSDVAFGLDAVLRGYRNVCSPFGTIRHLESATRGTNVPQWDFFMSYWRYNTWLFGGDPYFSPNVSLSQRIPTFRSAADPTPQDRISTPLGRSFTAFRQSTTEAESNMLAHMCRALPIHQTEVDLLHAENAEPFEVRTVNWYIPDIDSPFYGGINTALRIADELARVHGVENRFVVWGAKNENFVRSALTAAFPALRHSELFFYTNPDQATLQSVPYADASIATLWATAYAVAHAPNTKRKFYLIQDFEPMFYPASTLYALAEESYKLGLYGLCNTENMHTIYSGEYGGKGMPFTPAVDPSVFHANGRKVYREGDPVTLFVYARPGHWRNCWEMASQALEELKRRLGDRVRIVTAGAWAQGGGAEMDIKRLGLLDYRATGQLYRQTDVGLALTVSKHPSYLPLELMACGAPIVAFDNPWGYWVLKDGENSVLAKRTVDSLADSLEKICVDTEMRLRMQDNALQTIAENHSDWSTAIAPIYPYLCDPEGRGR